MTHQWTGVSFAVQTDDFVRPCAPDLEALTKETGIEVTNLASLKEAMHKTFELNAPAAVAVKTQYNGSTTDIYCDIDAVTAR